MTKIDIFSGFLGAGKTTLIKKLIDESFKGEKLVLIENEFGEIGIDGGFLKDAGINITEMNSGCICCSLVGDFGAALKKVLRDYGPDRILIEPSGVGKLSDVMKAVENVHEHALALNSYTAVVDVNRCKMYMKNFGEFFCDQIRYAQCIVLSHTGGAKEEKIAECVKLLREQNAEAVIVSTPWDQLSGTQFLEAIEGASTINRVLEELKEEDACPVCGHSHKHDHEHDHCHEHSHEHHHEHCRHDGEQKHECCHGHEQEHEHCHGHHHHGHHHADEVFQSFGTETTKQFSKDELVSMLSQFNNEEKFGVILRAKGIVPEKDGNWLHFDYVPGTPDVREGAADITGRICVIGAGIKDGEIRKLFGLDE